MGFKRTFLNALAIVSLLLALPCLAAEQKLTVILDWFVNPNHAPLFVAEQQGFFSAQGLKINFINPADASDPSKLVAVKHADIAVTYQTSLLQQVDQGMPLVRIASLIDHPLNCLAVLNDSPIHSLPDLKHRRIGYSSASVDEAIIKTLLKSARLNLNDVTLINVHFNLTQALLSKQVDAVIGVGRNYELIQMALAGHPARAFYLEQYGFPSYDELIVVTHRDLQNDPRIARFIVALTEGVHYLQQHPQQSWLTFAKLHPELNNEMNKKAWFATLPYFAAQPAYYNPKRYQAYAEFLEQQGIIKTTPRLDQYTAPQIKSDHQRCYAMCLMN